MTKPHLVVLMPKREQGYSPGQKKLAHLITPAQYFNSMSW